MSMLLHRQIFEHCRCFDGLPYLLYQRMRLPIFLVDHLQSLSQLLQQHIIFVNYLPFLLGFYFGLGCMPLQVLQQLCYLPLRAFRSLYQPLDPFQLGILQTCVSCATCLGVFDGLDKRVFEIFVHLKRQGDLIILFHCHFWIEVKVLHEVYSSVRATCACVPSQL